MIYAYQAIAVLAILYAWRVRAELARVRGHIRAMISLMEHDDSN